MPSAAVFNTCARAVAMMGDCPPILRDVPEIRAVIYGDAMETDRQLETLDALQQEMFPQRATEVGLPWWERLFRLSPGPPGYPLYKRQEQAQGAAARLNQEPTGVSWQEDLTLILGTSSWSYVEHDPADPTTPPAYVIRIVLPFDPADFDYLRAESLIRAQSPAGWDFVLAYDAGFELGESLLGEEPLG